MSDIDYYRDLGLDSTASDTDIKKAYRNLAKKFHPYKNPNNKEEAETKFKKISKAYSILSDPQKRKRYDKFGPGAFDDGDGPGFDPFDIFNNVVNGGGMPFNFMGGFNPFGGRRQHQDKSEMKSPVKTIPLKMSMGDLYLGKTININYTRRNKCSQCQGLGVKDKSCFITCDVCDGKGMMTEIKRMGPITQHITKPCNKCDSKGEMAKSNSECSKCKGSKIEKDAINLEIYIPAGAQNGHKIKFNGKSDWEPGFGEPGDLVFIIIEQKHEFFTREGCNLIMHRFISLKDALIGFKFRIFHLDGRILELESKNIIRVDQIMKIGGEGMPKGPDEPEKGDLIIKFDIIFPSHLDEKRKRYLDQILSNLEPTEMDNKLRKIEEDKIEKYEMGVYSLSESSTSNYSSQMDDDREGETIECNQQ